MGEEVVAAIAVLRLVEITRLLAVEKPTGRCFFTLGCCIFYRGKRAIECEGIATSWLLYLLSWVYPDYLAVYSLSLFLGSVCYFVCSVCSECKEGEPLSASFGNLRDLKPGVLTGK